MKAGMLKVVFCLSTVKVMAITFKRILFLHALKVRNLPKQTANRLLNYNLVTNVKLTIVTKDKSSQVMVPVKIV